MGRLIIEGNRVYELDEACLKKKRLPERPPVKEKDRRKQGGGQGAHGTADKSAGVTDEAKG